MPASLENDSDILLGNKQLLAVFAVVAILLAVAFTGGYMLGKGSSEKKASSQVEAAPENAPQEAAGGPITQRVPPADPDQTAKSPAAIPQPKESFTPKPPTEEQSDETILGRRNAALISPQAGQTFVQVAAVSKKDAEATADVLRQHSFKARIARAPGNSSVFRVLVGPAKDGADLRNTEDELRKIGYTKCFPQHY